MPLLTRKRKNFNQLMTQELSSSTISTISNISHQDKNNNFDENNTDDDVINENEIENPRKIQRLQHQQSSNRLLLTDKNTNDIFVEYSSALNDTTKSIENLKSQQQQQYDENNYSQNIDDSLFDRQNDDENLSISYLNNKSINDDDDDDDDENINDNDNDDERIINEYDTGTGIVNNVENVENDENQTIQSSYKNTLSANIIHNSNEIDYDNGEIGHIREIILKNFMCHKNFHLKLGPRINFITGPNGSGKSAILTGILLGFGGRSSITNRGSGLSSFIKNGESRAQIIIKLANYIDRKSKSQTINDGYKYEKYGKTIIIERTININGTSVYKLKSEYGKVISEKHSELDNILAHFSIIIDNPICILTQEISKNFLNSKNPHEKFNFYTKATRIEETKMLYQNCYQNHENTKKIISEKKNLLKTYKNELEKYRQQIDTIELIRDNVNIIKNLNNEALWSCINESQKDLDEKISKFSEIVNNIEQISNELSELNNNLTKINDEKLKYESDFKNYDENLKLLQNEYNEVKQLLDKIKLELINKESEINLLKRNLNIHGKEIDDLCKKIDSIENSQNNNNNDDDGDNNNENKNEMTIENLRKNIQKKFDEKKLLNEKLNKLKMEKEFFLNEKLRYDEKVRAIKVQINFNEKNLQRLQISNMSKNRLARYGDKFIELNDRINKLNQMKKFRHKPYGPIGEYLNLLDYNAAYVVEYILKKMIYSYVVDNNNDAIVLRNLINEIFGSNNNEIKPTIIIRKFVPLHNVTKTQVTTKNYQNFLQLLNIKKPDNDPVANCLIDHLKIEQILYIPNFNDAQHLLSHRELVPKNLQRAYTINGDLMFPSTNRSDFKCYPNNNNNRMVKILVKNPQELINEHQNKMNEYKINYDELMERFIDYNEKIEENKKSITLLSYQLNQCDVQLNDMENKRQELEEKLLTIKPIEVITLKEEVQKLQQEYHELMEQYKLKTNERDQIHEEYKKLLNETEIKNDEYKKLLLSKDTINDNIEKINDKHIKLMNDIKIKNNEEKNLLNIKIKYEENLDKLKRKINNEKTIALEKTNEPIETNRSIKEIQKEINSIKSIIKLNEHMLDPEKQKEIYQTYNELNHSINNTEIQLNDLNRFYLNYERSIVARRKAYFMYRTYNERTVNLNFQEFLKQKNFKGRINVCFNNNGLSNDDHDEQCMRKNRNRAKSLELIIQPYNYNSQNNDRQILSQQSTNTASASSTKSLSGGERSFSTVAFIISLWQICQTPFRVLDEIDVFMDMTTRKISLDSLIEFAAIKSNKQFIFLSPLSIKELDLNKNCIKIFQMPEPERNNRL